MAAPSARAVTRALIIGIDNYAHVQKLDGAVADTRDLEQTLRRLGVTDIRVLRNAEAHRGAVLAALEQLSASARTGDSVLVHFAGHGAREPERIAGSKANRLDQVFLLQPFNPQEPNGASEKILDSEFNHYVKRLEAAGARAILVLDACSGRALAREIDARATHPIYRTVEYTPVKDHLVSVAGDDLAFPEGVKRSWLLAAADQNSRISELNIADVGLRGALSYGLARGLEGAADLNEDGTITAGELAVYVRQLAHQFSDGRQTVISVGSERADLENFAVASYGRGITVRPAGSPPPESAGLTILPVEGETPAVGSGMSIQGAVAAPKPSLPSIASAPANSPLPSKNWDSPAALPIKLASLDGKATWFAGLPQGQSVSIVPPAEKPDLVWDPRSRDVLAGPDVIARSIDPPDLTGVIEHLRVLERLKQRSVRAAQPIILLPSDQLHTKGTRVEIEVRDLTGRFLVLFNVSGTGAVQLLYPLGSDPPQPADAVYSLELQVRDPFGAEHIVAVTSGERLSELEALLRQSVRRLNADRLGEVLNRFEGRGTRVGYVGLFTSP